MTNSRRKKWIIGAVCLGIVFASITALKHAGFHFDNFSLVHGGTVVLSFYDDDTRVFLNNKRKDVRAGEMEEGLIKNVPPGEHSLLIFKDGYWPWLKMISVETGTSTRVAPFLISKNVNGVILTSDDEGYNAAREALLSAVAPTKDSPAISESGQVRAWTEGLAIIAEWIAEDEPPSYFCDENDACQKMMTVTESVTPLRNIAFFQGRDDVLLIASQNGIFAIELDRRGGTQNFQPVYKGAGLPQFAFTEDNALFVLDGELIFQVNL